VLFIARTPGYAVDLMSYLFGNILLVPREDLWLMAGLDAVLLLTVAVLRRPLLAGRLRRGVRRFARPAR